MGVISAAQVNIHWAKTPKMEIALPAAERPTWREMLNTARQLQAMPSEKCIAYLSEIHNAAITARQEGPLSVDHAFVQFTRRIAARAFSFSGPEAFLLLAAVAKLRSRWPRVLLTGCFEQLAEDVDELDDMQLAHLAVLLARVPSSCADGIAAREGLARMLTVRAPHLAAKELCMAAAGLSAMRHGDEALLVTLAEAGGTMELSTAQRASLAASLAQLGLRDDAFFTAQLAILGEDADALGPRDLCSALLALAEVGIPLSALEQRAVAIAQMCSAMEALHVLRALCVLRAFRDDLVPKLLRRVASVPRSAFSDANDNGLHQVALSLLHEPAAAGALAAARADAGVWLCCYQPDEAVGELRARHRGRARVVFNAVVDAAVAVGWEVEVDDDFGLNDDVDDGADSGGCELEFYAPALLLLRRGDGDRAAVDIDATAAAWWRAPSGASSRLKHRHLALWGVQPFWVNATAWAAFDDSKLRSHAEALFVDSSE
eukprot:NODE_5176_length_1800_cov_6.247460.p1 GENE.NODE_5176_length_1800_cov_6.247460~~NODE_5176_length_1800_cov_6.247460.p1  ORF type:complete len:547 (+),score=165.41 NODE_5176_length_1800_cov_6.247460:177-1643(+)